ncbi:MAG: AraC family transcriptional regulator [Ruminococcaceae bacterium]|nr:AraC family transcriptional regulator [Oscillospiraceae bacterium]
MNYLPPIFLMGQVDMDKLCRIPIHSKDDQFYYDVNPGFRGKIMSTNSGSPLRTLPHIHPAIEFFYVEKGQLDVEIEKEPFVIRENQMVAFSSFTQHALYSKSGMTGWLLIIPPQFLPGMQKLLHKKAFANPVCCDDGDHSLLNHLHLIDKIHDTTGVYSALTPEQQEKLLLPLLQSFLGTVIAICGLRDNIQASPLFVSAIEYIHAHYHEPIRIPEMARALLCEQHTLSDQFREAFGITITAYANRLRAIELHAILSRDASLTLMEAAGTVGFGSMRSLLRAYREVYGTTPSNNR